jgi:SAM-dependent methyltransferase
MKSADYQLKKNEFGFFEIDPKPSKEFLAAFYAEKYFQNDAGNYRAEYSKEELVYFKNRNIQKKIILEETFNLSAKRILDIGCGEGFTLKNFQEFGWEVIGIDFSNFGIRNKNPELLPHFIEGDLLENMTILTSKDE